MAKITAIKAVSQAVNFSADSVGRNKSGNIVVRKGYFYRNGQDAHSFAEKIETMCTDAGVNAKIVTCGDVWKAFRGGASVANSSHFFVELAVTL